MKITHIVGAGIALIVIGAVIFSATRERETNGFLTSTTTPTSSTSPIFFGSSTPERAAKAAVSPVLWGRYHNSAYGITFEYPDSFNVIERNEKAEVLVQPKRDFSGEYIPRMSVVVLSYPDVEDTANLARELFYLAYFADGRMAWFNKRDVFDYTTDYFIASENITFNGLPAIRVRERDPELGEYRYMIYVLDAEADRIYRITRDLLHEAEYGDILRRAEASITFAQ